MIVVSEAYDAICAMYVDLIQEKFAMKFQCLFSLTPTTTATVNIANEFDEEVDAYARVTLIAAGGFKEETFNEAY